MKTLKLFFTLLFTIAATAQAETVMNLSYLDIPIQKIGRFMELHEQVTNMQLGEKRTLQGQWVMSHYYGSGPTIVVQDNYASAEDAVNDDAWIHVGEKWEAASEEERKEMESIVSEYSAFWNGHTDEIRTIDWDNNVRHSEDMDWDTRFFVLFGNYQTTGNTEIVGDAFNNWLIFPGIEDGSVQSGGFSSHLSGGGSDLQVWTIHSTLEEYVNSISLQGNAEGRSTFWENVEGNHSDNMFVHRGHVVDGKFDLAGPDKE